MLRELLRHWLSRLTFEPEATNWPAWRQAVGNWRRSAEAALVSKARAAIEQRTRT